MVSMRNEACKNKVCTRPGKKCPEQTVIRCVRTIYCSNTDTLAMFDFQV